MSLIADLEDRIAEMSRLIAEREPAAERSFGGRLNLESLRSHREDLQTQLRIAMQERSVEIVELRFHGRSALNGSLPIHLLSKLSESFADSLHAATQRLLHGRQVRRITQTVKEMLDLRVAMAPGSTRLFISGSTHPDLFGNSAITESLEGTLGVFRAQDEDQLMDAVDRVGMRSAKGLRDFLATVKASDLTVDVSWRTPREELVRWEGNYNQVSRLARTLGQIREETPDTIKVVGEVSLLSASGRFALTTEAGTIVSGRFPAELLPDVEKLHLGEKVLAIVERTSVVSPVTRTARVWYSLLKISSTGQTELRAM